ncbi:MAG: hypothetical protein HFJ41_00365 [Clostridia bacterium]|nr:hypothetical protein [Clostridia bacterium]
MNKIIGKVNNKVIKLLNLNYKSEIPRYIADNNIENMKNKHLEDYNKYWNKNIKHNK